MQTQTLRVIKALLRSIPLTSTVTFPGISLGLGLWLARINYEYVLNNIACAYRQEEIQTAIYIACAFHCMWQPWTAIYLLCRYVLNTIVKQNKFFPLKFWSITTNRKCYGYNFIVSGAGGVWRRFGQISDKFRFIHIHALVHNHSLRSLRLF